MAYLLTLLIRLPLAALVLLLASCATATHIGNLSKPKTTESILVSKDIEWTVDNSNMLISIVTAYKVRAGTYTPEYEDDGGVYYRGEGRCWSRTMISTDSASQREYVGKQFTNFCGIYVPKASASLLKLYVYLGPDRLDDQTADSKPLGGDDSTKRNDDFLIADQVANNLRNVPTAQAALGAGIGMGILRVMITEDAKESHNRVYFFYHQPPATLFSEAVAAKHSD